MFQPAWLGLVMTVQSPQTLIRTNEIDGYIKKTGQDLSRIL